MGQVAPERLQIKAENVRFTGVNKHFLTKSWGLILVIVGQVAPERFQIKAENVRFTGVNKHFLTKSWSLSGVS